MVRRYGIQFAVLAAVLAIIFVFPWRLISWGNFSFSPGETITVVGEASSHEANQIATFSVGINVINDDKEAAITEANQVANSIVESVKSFGILDEDIKTQSMNIYQNQDFDFETQKPRMGQWNVSNTIEITLREVERVSELTDVLSSTGANNVWGPNFTLDESSDAEEALTLDAIENARNKAETMAEAVGGKLGRVLQVSEGSVSSGVGPLYRMDGIGSGGAPMEPGSTVLTRSVTVTFELR